MTEAINELPAPMLRRFSSADIAEFLNFGLVYDLSLRLRIRILSSAPNRELMAEACELLLNLLSWR
jgi:hypothetical protein